MSDKPKWGSGISEAMKADMKRVREEKAARFIEAARAFQEELENVRPGCLRGAIVYLPRQAYYALASILPPTSSDGLVIGPGNPGGLIRIDSLTFMPIAEL